jgi:hypothetical protein
VLTGLLFNKDPMTYRPYEAIISGIDSSAVRTNLLNSTGLTILKGTPVRINASGDLDLIDVSVDGDVLGAMGISNEMILTGTIGNVITGGKVEDVTGLDFGDYVYVSKTGSLTHILPSEGVGGFVDGDWVIRVGVVGKNQDDPLLKDLFVNIQIIGQI